MAKVEDKCVFFDLTIYLFVFTATLVKKVLK